MSFLYNNLYKACKLNNSNTATNILKNNPNKNVIEYIGKKGKTPLILACENKFSDVALTIIKKYSTNCNFCTIPSEGKPAFETACKNNLYDVIKEMLIYFPMNCNLDKCTISATIKKKTYKITPLMYFCAMKHNDLIMYTLQNFTSTCGLDIVAKSKKDEETSVLLILCTTNQTDIICYILNNHFNTCEINNINIYNKMILWFLKSNLTVNVKFLINKPIFSKLSLENTVQIFGELCKKELYDISLNILQFISEPPTYRFTKKKKTNTPNTDASDRILLRKLLMMSITHGTDHLVKEVLTRYKKTYKMINECRFCADFDKTVHKKDYCMSSHDELSCKKYKSADNDAKFKIQSIAMALCLNNYVHSFEYYMMEYLNNFEESLLLVYNIEVTDKDDEKKNINTSILIECMHNMLFEDITKSIVTIYPDECWVYSLNKYGILPYTISNHMEELSIYLVKNHISICNISKIYSSTTALISACENNMESLAIEILKYHDNNEHSNISINLDYINKYGETAMDIAIENELDEVREIISNFSDQKMNNLERQLEKNKFSLVQKEIELNHKNEELVQLQNKHKDAIENACFICENPECNIYISINCFHITRLCNDCHNNYINLGNCSVCREVLNLKKCYDTL